MPLLREDQLRRHPQKSALLQMAGRMDKWPNRNRGMPAGKYGQGHQGRLCSRQVFEKHTKADQRRARRSNCSPVKDTAATHAGRYAKFGFKSIQDRIECDPYYMFNVARAQITPDCCQFLEVIAKCLSPDFGMSRDDREKQLGTGVITRPLFMSDESRDIRKPLDVTKEAYIAHYARFFSLPQFAVLAMELLKAKG